MKPAPITDGLESSTEAWNCVRAALPKMHGQDAFQNWIEPLVFVGIEHGVLHLTAPTSFIGTWVSRNYGDTIRQMLCKEGIAVNRI